jgi:hypothetical protein
MRGGHLARHREHDKNQSLSGEVMHVINLRSDRNPALAPLLGLKRRRLMHRQHLIRLQITTGGAALEKYDVFEKRPEY